MNIQGKVLEELKEEVLESIEGKSDDEKREILRKNLILIGTFLGVVIIDHVNYGMLKFSLIAAQWN